MIRNSIMVFILFALCSCTGNKEEAVAITSTFDTVAIMETLTDTIINKDSLVEAVENRVREESQLYYIVSVAEEDNYTNLRAIAVKASKLLNFKFDTLERYYNTTKKRVVLPDNHPDDIYAGDYYLRRHGDDFVSIEMRNAYSDISLKEDDNIHFYSDTTKMFVFAGMFGEKKQADSLANILKKQFKTTKIIACHVFMGCMH